MKRQQKMPLLYIDVITIEADIVGRKLFRTAQMLFRKNIWTIILRSLTIKKIYFETHRY